MASKHSDKSELPAPPCFVPVDEARYEADQRAEKVREGIFRWVPLIVTAIAAVGSNAVLLAYAQGKIEQRIIPLESYVTSNTHEKLATLYITRPEFLMRTAQRDREMESMSSWMTRIEGKLDRLLERQNGKAD